MLRSWVLLVLLLPVVAQALDIERSMLRVSADSPLTLEDVQQSNDWTSVEAFGTHGFTSDVFWLRLVLNSHQDADLVAKLVYPIHDYVDIYHVHEDKLVQNWKMGDARVSPEWVLNDKHFSIPISVEKDSIHEIYIRIESVNSIVLEVRVLPMEEFDQASNTTLLLFGAFYGILLVMALYNLSLAFITSDKAYFVYVIYVIFFSFLAMTLTGDGYYWIWTGYPEFNQYSIMFAGGLLAIPTVLFPYFLLDVPNNAPKLKPVFLTLVGISILYLIFVFFLPAEFALKLINIKNLIYMLFLLCVAIYLTTNRVPVAGIYLAAWSFLITGMVILSLAAYNVLPMNDITRQANLAGGLIELVLLSIALAQRVRYERQAREKALKDALVAQAEAEETRVQFDELFRQAPVGVFRMDEKGNPTAINPILLQMMGYQSEREAIAIGKDIQLHFKNIEGLSDRLKAEGKVLDHETVLIGNGDQHLDCSVSLRAYQVNGEYVIEGFITDISERKRAQKIHDMMEKERLASVGQLVAGVAHEINTPLGINVTSLSHFKELLAEVDLAMENQTLTKSHFQNFVTDMDAITKMMEDNLKHMALLVARFKALSISQLDVEKAYTNMQEQLHAIMGAQFTLDETVEYEIECDENALIETYPGAWHIIISQLVENSTMHGFENQTHKKITIKLEHTGDGRWCFTYKDNGRGISQEVYDKVFEPFFTTRRGSKSNAGLGMYRVFDIVKQVLKGDIELVQGEGFALKIDFQGSVEEQ